MKFNSIAAFLILMILLSPTGAQAYSYGDPNEELLAEIYKQMAAELNSASPNFDAALAKFEPIKPELDMHMGTEPAQVVIGHLKSKDKDAVLTDMQKILVLNIARRFASIGQDFENYKQNKTLVAKANATYEALSPLVKQSKPELDQKLRGHFDQVLQSLGNPGLFGVGVKAPDKAAFDANSKEILSALQQQFKIESLEVGHFTGTPEAPSEQAGKRRSATDITDPRNWIPVAVILLVLSGVIVYAVRKKKRA